MDHYLGNVYIGSEYPYRFANDWMLLALGLVITALGSVQIFRGNYAKMGYMSQLERMATAIKCPNCGKEILQKTPYCPFCGHALQTQA
jgi:tRNA(Ile2) C34 agmatinyltransferase TiaS